MEVKLGMAVTGAYEVRSGFCSVCETAFDDEEQKPDGSLRYCPACRCHRLGKLKSSGTLGG